jgi:outer membrane protein with beta-barrel domain
MRVSAIACAFACFCSVPLFGQELVLGVKGGVNLATERFEGEAGNPSLGRRVGAVAGIFGTLPLLSWLELQPEALYAMKGAQLDLGGIKSSVGIDYLEVPVLVRVSPGGGRTLSYFVVGGPSIGFRLRARSRTQFETATEEIDISDDLERLDFGVAIGGGVERGSLVLDGRYTLGLKDIDKDKTDAVKVTNRTISVTIGLKF